MRIVVTCGDINGIGPEIALKALSNAVHTKSDNEFIFVCPKDTFDSASSLCNFSEEVAIGSSLKQIINSAAQIKVLTIGKLKPQYGKTTASAGNASLTALEKSREMLISQQAHALVTAPISKEAISLAGSKYPGHTEMIADWAGTRNFAMMFHSSKITGGLLSIHIPLDKVIKSVQRKSIMKKFSTIHAFMKNDLGIKQPALALLGVNPHAGENGRIGSVDEVLKQYILQLPFTVTGPFPADAFFGMKLYKNFDCTVSAYHDQLLIPFKLLAMDEGVNVTAGLSFVRTSPDHGTAFNIAGQGNANAKSMITAIKLAERIVQNRLKGGIYAN